jgi:DNA-binding SARP family transcriptional activator
VREFRILGPLEVLVDDRPVRLGGPKQRAALAILLLNVNRVVSVERLADALYAGAPPVTAVTQVQRQISDLRRLLGADAIETRAPGYALRVDPDRLDLGRFERLTQDAVQALEHNDRQAAVDLLRGALELWRGTPLADLRYESFAQPAIARLEELRLAATEQRLDVELELGRHTRVLAEIETLVLDHPLRERPRALLMLALYRAGRQAEALDVYRTTRESLVGEYGLEPTASLRELERRILVQDPALDLSPAARSTATPDAQRTLLVVALDEDRIDALLSVAAPLAALPDHAMIVARLLTDEHEVTGAAAAMDTRRASLGDSVRSAAFTSGEPARDVVRLATNYDVELVLLDGAGESSAELVSAVQHSPVDLAFFFGAAVEWTRDAGIFVAFGGGEDDWAALELAAWLTSAAEAPLKLVGTAGDPSRGRRDASRLLADASLAVQRVVGVSAEPLLAEPTPEALRAALEPATVVLTGFPARWPADSGGRHGAVLHAGPPALFVHRGTRPSGLAPPENRTRFSWAMEP